MEPHVAPKNSRNPENRFVQEEWNAANLSFIVVRQTVDMARILGYHVSCQGYKGFRQGVGDSRIYSFFGIRALLINHHHHHFIYS
jgi:hypothetical protein